MKRFAAIGTALMLAAACGSDGPTSPSNNTGPIIFTAQLSAANENPLANTVDSNARGTVTITFNVQRDASTGAVTGGGTARFQAQMQGFPAGQNITLAHIHTGGAAVNGPVLVNTGLSAGAPIVADSNGNGTLDLTNSAVTQDWATQIVANPSGFYFNVHTVTNPNGAMRGQLVRQ